MPGVAIGHDVKHTAATNYQFGQGSGSARPALKDPAYVSHQNKQVDKGHRMGSPPKGRKVRGA